MPRAMVGPVRRSASVGRAVLPIQAVTLTIDAKADGEGFPKSRRKKSTVLPGDLALHPNLGSGFARTT